MPITPLTREQRLAVRQRAARLAEERRQQEQQNLALRHAEERAAELRRLQRSNAAQRLTEEEIFNIEEIFRESDEEDPDDLGDYFYKSSGPRSNRRYQVWSRDGALVFDGANKQEAIAELHRLMSA
jgi:hypothetical protein